MYIFLSLFVPCINYWNIHYVITKSFVTEDFRTIFLMITLDPKNQTKATKFYSIWISYYILLGLKCRFKLSVCRKYQCLSVMCSYLAAAACIRIQKSRVKTSACQIFSDYYSENVQRCSKACWATHSESWQMLCIWKIDKLPDRWDDIT